MYAMAMIIACSTLLAFNFPLGGATIDVSDPEPHYERMVAMVCPKKGEPVKRFQNKFLTLTGKWETDYGVKATCKTGKLDILEYCKQVYPDLKITNVIESNKFQKIDKWCKSGSLKCKGPAKWVKPYRCIEAAPVDKTTDTVETSTTTLPPQLDKLNAKDDEYLYDDDEYLDEEYDDDEDEDDYYYDDEDDEYYDDDYDEDEDEDDLYDEDDLLNKIDTKGNGFGKKDTSLDDLKIDPYYTHYKPSEEHREFTDALERLEDKHRRRMTKVMKEWTKIESKYESLAKSDKEHADKLKQEMADQFEKRIQGLEEDNQAERDQLVAMHQQRVISRMNQKKEEAMKCYTNALNESPLSYPNVRDCLEKLLKSVHKDRHHTLQHYRELVETDPAKAELQREVTLHHLTDIDRIINESLGLLDRFPELRVKLLPLMEDFLIELRSHDDTPAPLFSMSKEEEEKILDGFKTNVQNRIFSQEEKSREEKRRRTEEMKEMKRKMEEDRMDEEDPFLLKQVEESEDMFSRKKRINLEDEPLYLEDKIVLNNAQAHQLLQDAPMYSVREVEDGSTTGLRYTLLVGVAGLTILIVVGVGLQRRRHVRIRSHQGFVEVPTYASPEEKHLSTMQANGYENPTYKYFEVNTA